MKGKISLSVTIALAMVLFAIIGFVIKSNEAPKLQHEISIQEAEQLIGNYLASDTYSGVESSSFIADEIRTMLDQDGVEYMEAAKGVNPDGTECLVLFGADKNRVRLLATILEKGILCPPICGDVDESVWNPGAIKGAFSTRDRNLISKYISKR